MNNGGFFGEPIDITHYPKRMQADNVRPQREPEENSNAPENNITIEKAIRYYEERVAFSPEPTVPVNLIPLYAQTAIWLRAYMSKTRKAEGENVADS